MRLRELNLLVGGQQVDAPDRTQVEPQRVEARLDGQVDLDLLGPLDLRSGRILRRRLDAPAFRSRGPAVGLDHVDSVLVQVGVQLLDLLLGYLNLLEALLDLAEGQISPLLRLYDQRSQLVELRDRGVVAQ